MYAYIQFMAWVLAKILKQGCTVMLPNAVSNTEKFSVGANFGVVTNSFEIAEVVSMGFGK